MNSQAWRKDESSAWRTGRFLSKPCETSLFKICICTCHKIHICPSSRLSSSDWPNRNGAHTREALAGHVATHGMVAMGGPLWSEWKAYFVTEGAISKCQAASLSQKEALWGAGTLLGKEEALQVLPPSDPSGALLTSVMLPQGDLRGLQGSRLGHLRGLDVTQAIMGPGTWQSDREMRKDVGTILHPVHKQCTLPTSWNRKKKKSWTSEKTVISDWNRNKISLIFKQKWVFMESLSIWINVILRVLEMKQLDIANNGRFWGGCAIPPNSLQSVEKALSEEDHLWLIISQCRALSYIPNDRRTWDDTRRQKRMAAWLIDFLLLVCVAYFKSLGGRKFMKHLCSSQMLRYFGHQRNFECQHVRNS